MKIRIILAALLGLAMGQPFAFGTTITASKIQSDISGTLLASGYLCLTPVNAQNQPTGFTAGSGGVVLPNQYCFAVTNGSLGTVNVADTSTLSPLGIGYQAQVQTSAHIPIYNFPQPIFPTGSTWSLDTWTPSISVPVTTPTVTYYSAAPTGPCGTAPAIAYTSTTLYSCIGNVWTVITSASGTPGPTGPTGPAGTAATVAVGTTSTLSPGASATVTNSGSSSAAVFNFGIPQGAAGATGATGAAGATGATGAAGSAATVAVGTTTTLSPGSSATVTNSGTSSAAVFNFGIPQGAAGTGGGITGVTAGTGLSGGGTSGTVSLTLAGALPSTETATTQTAGDTSALVANDNFVSTAISNAVSGGLPFQGGGADIQTADILSTYQLPCVANTDLRLGTSGCPYIFPTGGNLQTEINTVAAIGPSNIIVIPGGVTATDTTGNGFTLPDAGVCVSIQGAATGGSVIAESAPTFGINGTWTATGSAATLTQNSGTPLTVGQQVVFSGVTGISGIASQAPVTITAVSGTTLPITFTFASTIASGSGTVTAGTGTIAGMILLGKTGHASTPANCSYKNLTFDGGGVAARALELISMTNLQVENNIFQNIARGENGAVEYGESSGSYPTTGIEAKNNKCSMSGSTYNSSTAANYCTVVQTSATDGHFTTTEGTNVKQLYRILGGSTVVDGQNHVFGGGIATGGAYVTASAQLSGFECDELTSNCITFGPGSNGSSVHGSFGVYNTPQPGAAFASICSTCDYIDVSGNNLTAYLANGIAAPVVFPGTHLPHNKIDNTPDFSQTTYIGPITVPAVITPPVTITAAATPVIVASANPIAPATNVVSTSGTYTITAANSLVAGEPVSLSGFTTATALNGVTTTVLSAGLSSTQYEVTVGSATVASHTDGGIATPVSGELQTITLTSNTSPVLTGVVAGAKLTLRVCNGTTAYSWTPPSGLVNAVAVPGANACTQQSFVSYDGSTMTASPAQNLGHTAGTYTNTASTGYSTFFTTVNAGQYLICGSLSTKTAGTGSGAFYALAQFTTDGVTNSIQLGANVAIATAGSLNYGVGGSNTPACLPVWLDAGTAVQFELLPTGTVTTAPTMRYSFTVSGLGN